MNVLILSTTATPYRIYSQLTTGKVSAFIGVPTPGSGNTFQVICQNQHHKVWRGSGRFFHTLEEALSGYKSPEMRAMINAAAELADDPI
jgi:hypothetical protein